MLSSTGTKATHMYFETSLRLSLLCPLFRNNQTMRRGHKSDKRRRSSLPLCTWQCLGCYRLPTTIPTSALLQIVTSIPLLPHCLPLQQFSFIYQSVLHHWDLLQGDWRGLLKRWYVKSSLTLTGCSSTWSICLWLIASWLFFYIVFLFVTGLA